MSSDRTLEVNLGMDEHDELDRKIDRALGRVGALIRTLFVIGLLAFLGLFVVYPQWDVMGPFITTGLYLVFQLFYVAFLMIFQFIVLFWFIGRPRIYWLMPGETGVGFKDYKGNPEVLESARQVVTLLKGGGGGALNELLNQMDPLPRDGFKDKILRMFGMRKGKAEQPPVLTIAATNLVSVLDAALLRPGRFDRQLRVGFPSYDGRREIFDFSLGKVKHVDLPIDQMVAETVNYSPAQIKHVVNEAVVHAVWNGRDAIDYNDFRWALETYEWGMRQPVIGMTYADKRRLAYHEAGHAVAAVKLLKRERVARATIEARHDIGAAALVSFKPVEEIHTQTKDELLAHMQISLASRAAEQMFLGPGEEMAGASGDLAS